MGLLWMSLSCRMCLLAYLLSFFTSEADSIQEIPRSGLPLQSRTGSRDFSGNHTEFSDDFDGTDSWTNALVAGYHAYSDDKNQTIDVLGQCKAFQESFATMSAKFIRCSVHNSNPLRMCVQCVGDYERATEVYTYFKNVSSPCHSQLLKSDRVQILTMVYDDLVAIWTKAYCSNCFSSVKLDSKNGTVSYNLSSAIEHFLQLYNNTTACFNRTNATSPSPGVPMWNTTLCRECRDDYSKLNTFFENTMTATDRKVCMDIVDMMNYTRKMWGGVYHCTHSTRDDVSVISFAACLCLAPIFLYGGARLFGLKSIRHIMKQKRLRVQVQDSFYGSVSLTSGPGHNGVGSNAVPRSRLH